MLDPAVGPLLTSVLPPVTYAVAPSAEASETRRVLEQILDEHLSARPGASFAMAQHAQLLLLKVLRASMANDGLPKAGWLPLLADPNLRAAVSLMHDDPAQPRTLAELAAAASMSRSQFAQRFRGTAGQTPMAYLAQWRVRLAERWLRETDTTVAALSEWLGYASESSFSHAFTRISGISPSGYRRRHGARGQLMSTAG